MSIDTYMDLHKSHAPQSEPKQSRKAEKRLKVLIIGTGALAQFVAVKLLSGSATVLLVSRSQERVEHFEQLGVRLLTPNYGDVENGGAFYSYKSLFTTTFEDAIQLSSELATTRLQADIILVCCKSSDLLDYLPHLAKLVGADTRVVMLQNGVESEARALEYGIPMSNLYGGAAYIEAETFEQIRQFRADGSIKWHYCCETVVEHSVKPSIFMGQVRNFSYADPKGPLGMHTRNPDLVLDEPIARLMRALNSSGIRAYYTSDYREWKWKKLMLMHPLAGLTSLLQLRWGVLRNNSELMEIAHALVREVAALATRCGYGISIDALDDIFKQLENARAESFPSLARDIAIGKRGELDDITGAVVRLSLEHGFGFPATCSRMLYALLDAKLKAMSTQSQSRSRSMSVQPQYPNSSTWRQFDSYEHPTPTKSTSEAQRDIP